MLLGAVGLVAALLVAAVARGGEEPFAPSGIAGAEVIGALGDARTASDQLPKVAADELVRLGIAGVEPALSVRTTTQGDRSIYLTPARERVCISLVSEAGASVSCEQRQDIDDGTTYPATLLTGCSGSPETGPRCDEALVFGLAPNDVSSVTLTFESGRSEDFAVANNTYYISVSPQRHPISIGYTSGGRSISLRVPLPNSG